MLSDINRRQWKLTELTCYNPVIICHGEYTLGERREHWRRKQVYKVKRSLLQIKLYIDLILL